MVRQRQLGHINSLKVNTCPDHSGVRDLQGSGVVGDRGATGTAGLTPGADGVDPEKHDHRPYFGLGHCGV
ncbi:hypothetical protein [Planobispora longispora]|uniref:hypothetical protein n=1 Tax=Planobispora longispora TaxID=28887 RepID=UPI0019439F9A|nr:hypothetical protein [Planobispora longispora]